MTILLHLWPGVCLGLCGLALDRVLRRWFDPVPVATWALFAVLVFALLGPTLFLGATLGPLDKLGQWVPFEHLEVFEDALVGDEGMAVGNPIQNDLVEELLPWLLTVRRSYLEGELPLWNPWSGAGALLLANPQAFAVHPFLFLSLLVPEASALPFIAGLRLLTTLVFSYLFFRRAGLGFEAARVASCAFGLSGFLLHFLTWPHANAIAGAAACLYALARWFDGPARSAFLLLVLSHTTLLLSGHPETMLHALLLLAAFTAFRLLRELRSEGSRAAELLMRKAVPAALAGLLSLGLAAPALLPAAEYLPLTNRYAEMQERNEAFARLSWSELDPEPILDSVPERMIPIAAPNAFGSSRHGAFWGFQNSNESSTGFAGSSALLCALLAAFLVWRRPRANEVFFLLLLLVGVVVIFHPPGLMLVLVRLPLLDSSPLWHRRVLWWVALAASYLLGSCVDRWRKEHLARLPVVVCAAFLASLVAGSYLANPPSDPEVLAHQRLLWLLAQLLAIVVTAGLLATRYRSWKAGLVTATVVLELLIFHRPLNPSLPGELFFPQTELTQALGELQESPPGFRSLGHHAALPPELPSIYRLRDPRAQGPSLASDLLEIVEPLGMDAGGRLWDVRAHPTLLDLLAVRYVYERPGLQGVTGPLRHVGESGAIWERESALPMLFLPQAARTRSREDWSELHEVESFRDLAIVVSGADAELSLPWKASAQAELLIEAVGSGTVTARFTSSEPRLLASSLLDCVNWMSAAGADELASFSVNGPFVGAWLPAGEYDLILRYRPRSFSIGLGLAAMSLIGVGALSITGVLEPR